jgi:Rps23 Pro-64 3,4-dihydroxylase Tpa1-like proline 4-hydroxylase
MIEPYFFDEEPLLELARSRHDEYLKATPFPHVVLDDFLPARITETVLSEFPSPEAVRWKKFDAEKEQKLASTHEEQFGDFTRHLFGQFNGQVFVNFLEALTGIEGLVPDPHLVGGGLHQIEPGGFLEVHADFNKHDRLRLDRRLNVLLYLNKDWKEEYGGFFELWNEDATRREQRVLPIFNRCVVFSTTDYSFHGHPDPLACPPGRTRKSLALYYYSNGRPASERSRAHSTVFRDETNRSWTKKGRSLARQVAQGVGASKRRS